MSRIFKNIKKWPPQRKRGTSFKNQNAKLRQRLASRRIMFPNIARPVNGAINKFVRHPGSSGEEVKTVDTLFTGAYAAAYTADQVPCQRLSLNTNTASVQCINLIQQGAGTSQRIGHKVSLKSVRIRLNLAPTINATSFQTYGRCILLYDRDPVGVYVATSTILANITNANQTQAGIYTDNLNPNFFDRFVVLMDKFMVLPPYDGAGNILTGPTEISTFVIDEFVKLKDLECVYGNNTTNLQTANPMLISYIQTGALHLLTVGSAPPGGDSFALYGNVRLRFRDN
nr:MAG: capsid protein [Cressdnaviricota sp.]